MKVVTINEQNGNFVVGKKDENTIDYAVQMKKLDRSRQMDVLLRSNNISVEDILAVVKVISDFHQKTKIITEKDCLDVQKKFNELKDEAEYLRKQRGSFLSDLICQSLEQSDRFIETHKPLFFSRLKAGYFRDCHGDLHSRNIFLLPQPVIFDCIEFNDDYRQIDVLNEIAFLGMDLDAFGRHDLSAYLVDQYNRLFPVMKTEEEEMLFLYYKSYRANVRAKVNSLRARDAQTLSQRENALRDSQNYLTLMQGYLKRI